MNCRSTVARMLDLELGLLSDEVARRVERHIADCPGCAARLAREHGLSAELVACGRTEPPFVVDVTPAVMRRVAASRFSRRETVPASQLAWAGAAAAASVALLLAALWLLRPELTRLAHDGTLVASSLAEVAMRLIRPARTLLSVPLLLVGSLVRSLSTMTPLIDALRPYAAFASAGGYAALAAGLIACGVRRARARPTIA